ncbi:Spore germination protein [Wickerhamomyces ciferrii]|uniref:Spore germination protein n=1 Tax=Wickerhamomyces ciferrii (strain ATCC 14091 / BCRC 22168 / CBS 111 / JCM 3599 / NBRC 0793 / NRRL Y-1031 F-60-10) TaxID=1206466 RepID=K0KLE9_WICCF|nr:Spore germination protein [Wickerhamomyces ciferrii]CCH43037.1 Spore germination protein [Wickerhamomyces ciferrii]
MSEQPKQNSRRRYYNRNRNQKKKQEETNENKPNKPTTKSSKPSKSNKPKIQQSTSITTSIKQQKLPLEESRSNEIKNLIYKLTQTQNISLINSNSKQKSFRINIESDSYKFIIPFAKNQSVSLNSISEELNYNKLVLKNFNNKTKKNDQTLLFYINYLINNYENLKKESNDYKFYEINKLI